jgi:hypothetical protein
MMTMTEIADGNKIPAEHQQNADTLLYRMSILRYKYGKPMKVNSGYRTPAHNATIPGASKTSWHTKAAAVDISDPDGSLYKWCQDNEQTLAALGLWMEDRMDTPTWCHFQIYPPKSGNRVFRK